MRTRFRPVHSSNRSIMCWKHFCYFTCNCKLRTGMKLKRKNGFYFLKQKLHIFPKTTRGKNRVSLLILRNEIEFWQKGLNLAIMSILLVCRAGGHCSVRLNKWKDHWPSFSCIDKTNGHHTMTFVLVLHVSNSV